MAKNKVCMALTNPFIHDARVYREATALVRVGYDVTVVAQKGRNDNLPADEIIDGVRVIRVDRIPKNERRGLAFIFGKIRRAPSTILFGNGNVLMMAKVLASQRADVYHAHDLDTLASSFLASRFQGAKLIYDSHEIFLESLRKALDRARDEGGYFRELAVKLAFQRFSLIESILIKRAEIVVTVNDLIARYLKEKYSLVRTPAVILNCNELVSIKETKKLHKKMGFPNYRRIILFQGNLQLGRGLENLVEAMRYVKVKDAVTVFMGVNTLGGKLVELARGFGVQDKVAFTGPVPHKELLSYTASAELGVIPYRNINLNHYYCSPNKIFEYMMAGVPMAVSDFPVLRGFAELGIGVTFDPEDPESIAEAINKVLENKTLLNQMRRRALKLAHQEYNWERESGKLLAVYKELLNEKQDD